MIKLFLICKPPNVWSKTNVIWEALNMNMEGTMTENHRFWALTVAVTGQENLIVRSIAGNLWNLGSGLSINTCFRRNDPLIQIISNLPKLLDSNHLLLSIFVPALLKNMFIWLVPKYWLMAWGMSQNHKAVPCFKQDRLFQLNVHERVKEQWVARGMSSWISISRG